MSDLVEFLRARLDEEEREARRAISERGRIKFIEPLPEDYRGMALEMSDDVSPPAVIVGPERILAEVEAKRRILELHAPTEMTGGFKYHTDGQLDLCDKLVVARQPDGHYWEAPACGQCADGEAYDSVSWALYPCPTLRSVAAVYADHPGYRPEWRL